jgi:hypothetical protein
MLWAMASTCSSNSLEPRGNKSRAMTDFSAFDLVFLLTGYEYGEDIPDSVQQGLLGVGDWGEGHTMDSNLGLTLFLGVQHQERFRRTNGLMLP